MKKTKILKASLKFFIHILFTIFMMKNLSFSWKQSLNHSMKGPKHTKHLIFMFQQVQPSHLSIIINKYHKPTNSRNSSNRGRFPTSEWIKVKRLSLLFKLIEKNARWLLAKMHVSHLKSKSCKLENNSRNTYFIWLNDGCPKRWCHS